MVRLLQGQSVALPPWLTCPGVHKHGLGREARANRWARAIQPFQQSPGHARLAK